MTDVLAHRGPDDAGVVECDPVTLGHRRLTILDLTDHGHQPITDPAGRVWLTYNGEIYNFRDVRTQLESLGHAFAGTGDTEVLLHAWLEWGEACIDRLNGMFAFAAWDTRERTLTVVRDRLGVKPLYYTELARPGSAGTQLVFASEIKALLASGAVARDVDPQSLYHFMGFEFVPGPRTIFRRVRELEPGCLLRWRNGRVEHRRYWQPDLAPVERPARQQRELLREQLRRSATMQLVADVDVGVFLSGGLDSSALVAFAASAGPVRTFSMGYPDGSYTELDHARFVAETFGTTHEELMLRAIDPETIDRVVWHLDEPMADLSAAAFFVLCEQTRRRVKVCLSGEGGDEAMAGYDRFKASRLNRLYTAIPALLRRRLIEPAILGQRDRPGKKHPLNMLKRFIEGSRLPADGEHIRWQFFLQPELEQVLFRPEFLDSIDRDMFEPVRDAARRAPKHDRVAREIFIDTVLNMPGSVLTKVDKLSMAHGLEVRVPFLDHDYVALCASVPSDRKLRGLKTRAIYREAMRGILPQRVLTRRKQGYSLPIKHWLRGDLRRYLRDSINASTLIRDCFATDAIARLMNEHDTGQANHSHLLWALVNLASWDRQFLATGGGPGSRFAEPRFQQAGAAV